MRQFSDIYCDYPAYAEDSDDPIVVSAVDWLREAQETETDKNGGRE